MNNEEDGKAEHHINQYIIKDEIGRGSFGAVHLAVDQYGKEFVSKTIFESSNKRRMANIECRQLRSSQNPDYASVPSRTFFGDPMVR